MPNFIPPAFNTILPWFPRHQKKAIGLLRDGIHHIDMFLEVRDARIPLSSANSQLKEILGRRDRMILFNKKDMANPNMIKALTENLAKHESDPFLFTTIRTNTGHASPSAKKVLAMLVEKANSDRQRFANMTVVVVGIPNVGKSSLLNALRNLGTGKKKVAEVHPFAGATKSISTKVKIHSDPNIYLVDTPGVLDLEIKNPIQGLRVALVGSTKDRLSDEVAVADYLLYRLNQSPYAIKSYTTLLGLKGKTTDIQEVLTALIERSHEPPRPNPDNPKVNMARIPRVNTNIQASHELVALFRKGTFGVMTLDDCSDEGVDAWFAHDAEGFKALESSTVTEGLRGKIIYEPTKE
ncbi:hypothetical protein HDU81_010474 [Chytriomyces hyalinus]|nr:hypothetical protein HDU81_010474 [Chytriomyces hyalinus]